MAENIKKMQEMGLHVLASELNKSVPPSASKKGQNKGNKKTNSNNSDSSEYLLDDDDQGGSSDDDTELSDEEPIPLAIKVLPLSSKLWLPNHSISFECFETVVYDMHLLSDSSFLCHASYLIYGLPYKCTLFLCLTVSSTC